MADVFISYAREEAARAEEVRRALEALGLSVFFDVERLDAGDVWSDVIDREIKTAGAVVALWSPHALSRPWVRKECALAQSRGVLLPALLDTVTDLDMPLQFSDLQRVDLTDFHGEGSHAGWRKLIRALGKTLKRNDLLVAQIAALKEEKQTGNVKAELEALQRELEKLRKSKGGVKPALMAVVVAGLVTASGAAAWWGMEEIGRREQLAKADALKREKLAAEQATTQVRASIVDPDVIKALSEAEIGKGSPYKIVLSRALAKASLARLIEASTVDANASLLAGFAFLDGVGGVKKDEKEAARYFQRSCDLNNAAGCNNLGFSYERGDGLPKDVEKAVGLYQKACEAGYGVGCTNLGYMYETGQGTAKDLAKAATFYVRGCDGGNGRGCTNLGTFYENGIGVPKDGTRAVSLYQRACDSGNAAGCYSLGLVYANAQAGVAKDQVHGARLFKQACDGGEMAGCATLGYMHAYGMGVARDNTRALALYKQACDGGNSSGCDWHKEFTAQLTRN